MRNRTRAASVVFASWALLAGVAGCASRGGEQESAEAAQSAEAGAWEWSDQVLKDPYNYSPKVEKPDTDKRGVGDFDEEGLQKDVDNFLLN